MQTLFISDLHLSAASTDIRQNFLRFLQEEAPKAETLYILGDLFEVWVGDDDNAPWLGEIKEALKNLTASSVRIFIMPGNRDFLLGKKWVEACGAVLLSDPTVIDLYGIPTLLTHGDSLCMEDRQYQRWRVFSRHPIVQWLFLKLPLKKRQHIAHKLRDQSQAYVQQLPQEKMDVTAAAVEKWISDYEVKQMIHGHTHQPAIHQAKNYTRFVLPDWHPQGGALLAKPNTLPQLIFSEDDRG